MVKRKRRNINGATGSGTRNSDDVSKLGNDQSVDFFTSLPDNVITKIFHRLTMKEAFRTCVSCRRLKPLTSSIPNVEFNEINPDGCLATKTKFIEFVSGFLKNHESVVQKFKLSCSPGGYIYDIRLWLSSVVKIGIEEIDLMFCDASYPFIPTSLFTVETLKVLKLRKCVVDDFSPITGLKSLKSLLLGDMNISDDEMALLCWHCESLQYLTLQKCIGFEDIKILNPRSKLKTLILDGLYVSHVRLNILSLEKLLIRSSEMNFSFVGRPHIDDLVLCRGALKITWEEYENMEVDIFNKLHNVRSLHLGGWAFECFSAVYGSIENRQMTNLEVLSLDFDVCLHNQMELNNVVRHAESLKTLILSMNQNISAREYSIYTVRNFEGVFENLLNIFEAKPRVEIRKNSYASSTTIENIYIKNFTGTIYEVSYIKFVLAHFQHLRVITVTPMEGMDEGQSRAYAKLFSRFHRVSSDVYMLMGSEEVWKAEEA